MPWKIEEDSWLHIGCNLPAKWSQLGLENSMTTEQLNKAELRDLYVIFDRVTELTYTNDILVQGTALGHSVAISVVYRHFTEMLRRMYLHGSESDLFRPFVE